MADTTSANALDEKDNSTINCGSSKITEELYLELSEKLKPFGINSEEYDADTLRRFLVARNNNAEKAAKMFAEHVKWKKEFLPGGKIEEAEIPNELAAEKGYLIAKPGKVPVLVAMYKKHNALARNIEEFKRFCVYCVDKTVLCLPPGEEKFHGIVDMKGAGLSNFDASGMIAAFSLLQNHYPERLGKVLMINVTYLFWGIWTVVSPFLDHITREKIVFVEDDKIVPTLKAEIDEDILPVEYGGKGSFITLQAAEIPDHSTA